MINTENILKVGDKVTKKKCIVKGAIWKITYINYDSNIAYVTNNNIDTLEECISNLTLHKN